MTGEEFVESASMENRGNDWGETLWAFVNDDACVEIDVQAPDQAAAESIASSTYDSIYNQEG